MPNAAGENAAFTGIARFRGSLTCTAFLLDTGGDTAYVMTAGHCISTATSNEVIRDQAVSARVTFHFFRDTQPRAMTVAARRTVYSTMKARDLAILELDTTLAALKAQGVTPLALGAADPVAGVEVRVVGAPTGAVPTEEQFLRQTRCMLGEPVDLLEFQWHFRNAYPNACSDIRTGSSGSPVLDSGGRVVSLINTTTAEATHSSGDFPCYLGQPCELTDEGYGYRRDTNYALPVAAIRACFPEGRFTLGGDCPLDDGRQLRTTGPNRYLRPGAAWNVALSSDSLTHYRYKTYRQGQGDCRVADGYGPVQELAAAPRITDALPREAGLYLLCVLAGRTAQVDGTWQRPEFATLVHTRVDTSKPMLRAPYVFRDDGDFYFFEPIFVVPELSGYRYKIAATAADACDGNEGYRNYLRIPIRIDKRGAPYRLCFFGTDMADNASDPVEIRLSGLQLRPEGVLNAASLQPGGLGEGVWATVFGVNLQGAALRFVDAVGAAFAIEPAFVSASQINFRLPERAAAGMGRLTVTGPAGEADARISIGMPPQAIFTAAGSGFGPPLGFAGEQPLAQCASPGFCGVTALRQPWADLVIYTNGARAGLTAALGGELLELRGVRRLENGVAEVTLRIPADFPLRGVLPLVVRSAGGESNTAYLRLAEEIGAETAAEARSGATRNPW